MSQDGVRALTATFLDELRAETDRLLDSVEHPASWKYQGSDLHVRGDANPIIQRLLDWKPALDALAAMGLGDFRAHGSFILLSKPPGGPALYWHQDWMEWNDPISLAPWPQYLFLSYYLIDTTPENGCFQVLPGTHTRRVPLHDRLTGAHEAGARYAEPDDPVLFSEQPGAVDVPVKAGSLVIGEGRALHAARANQSDQRRTLMLAWFSRPKTVPDYWTDPVPQEILDRDSNAKHPPTRIPGQYLRP